MAIKFMSFISFQNYKQDNDVFFQTTQVKFIY